MKPGPIPPLTSLRFFAAMAVVFYHYGRPFVAHAPAPVRSLAGAGYTGVSFFFVLSGFVLAYNYLASDREIEPRSFWAARAARIYPAYLVSLLLLLPVFLAGVRSAIHARGAAGALDGAISGGLCLSLLQAWFMNHANDWNFPAWSLSVEAFFYVTFPLTAALVLRIPARRLLSVAFGFWMVSIAIGMAYAILDPDRLGGFPSVHFVATHHPRSSLIWLARITTLPILRLPEFIAGLALGRAFVAIPSFRIPRASIAAALAIAGLLATLAYCDFPPANLFATSLLDPIYAVLILALASGAGPISAILSAPVLVLLGDASYAIYVLQVPVFRICRRFAGAGLVASLGSAIVLMIASVLVYKFIETPARRRIRAWLAPPVNRLRAARATAAD